MSSLLTASWLLPPDETERLCTLHRYTQPTCLHEPMCDGLLDLTARIFDLPLALLSLVDADEVVYKSNHGTPQLVRHARAEVICALTIRHNEPLVFTDLTQPTQYSCLPAAVVATMQHYGLRFYAGQPLRMPDQRPIGALCLAGPEARTLSTAEQQVLANLAELLTQALVVRHTCLSTAWLGEEHWLRIQDTLTEGIWELAALVRYLLKRTGPQVPVAPEVLEPVARRLDELHSRLTVHPASLL